MKNWKPWQKNLLVIAIIIGIIIIIAKLSSNSVVTIDDITEQDKERARQNLMNE